MPRIIEYIRIERVLTMKRARGLAAVAGTLYFVPENAPFDKKQIKHEKKKQVYDCRNKTNMYFCCIEQYVREGGMPWRTRFIRGRK